MLLPAILLAIHLAPTAQHLATWWQTHQAALKLLDADGLAAVVAAKDRKKAALTG